MQALLLTSPKIAMGLCVLLALVLDSVRASRPKVRLLQAILVVLAAAFVLNLIVLGESARFLSGALVVDQISIFADLALIVLGLGVALASIDVLGWSRDAGDFYLLLFLSLLGASLLAAAGNLIVVFLALELSIIPTWGLVAFRTRDRAALEAGIKYFMLSIFATGLLLYGFSLMYGSLGTVDLPLQGEPNSVPLLYIGLAFVIAAIGFELAAFPFHTWLPDVFQASYAEVGAFLSVGPKLAAIIALARVLQGLGDQRPGWTLAVAVVALVTMVWGNLVAFWQTSFKRFLAYSAIAHSGYALIGVAAGNEAGFEGAVLYFGAYGSAAVGAFLVLSLMAREGFADRISSFSGLGKIHPLLAGAMTVFLISLTGIPLFAGFWGKFSVFWGAVQGGMTWLAVLGVVNSAVSLGYYGRLIQRMYLEEPGAPATVTLGGTAPANNLQGPSPAAEGSLALAGVTSMTGAGYIPANSAAAQPPAANRTGPAEAPDEGAEPLADGGRRSPWNLRFALALAVILTIVIGVVPRLIFGPLG